MVTLDHEPSTPLQFPAVPTRVGVVRAVVVPSPNCPNALLPQHQSWPARRLQVWNVPALTSSQFERVPT